ncbi:MAG: hypothetical protein AB8E87_03695 [Prochlorococcus sp.]
MPLCSQAGKGSAISGIDEGFELSGSYGGLNLAPPVKGHSY